MAGYEPAFPQMPEPGPPTIFDDEEDFVFEIPEGCVDDAYIWTDLWGTQKKVQ